MAKTKKNKENIVTNDKGKRKVGQHHKAGAKIQIL